LHHLPIFTELEESTANESVMIYRGIDADGINQDIEVVSDRTAAARGSVPSR